MNALKVVNDTAERGIALIKKFNESVRDEQQKQFLLRVVEHHRKVVNKRTKKGLHRSKLINITHVLPIILPINLSV